MEFKINSSDLLKALSHIHGIVEVRHTLPILSNIILKANGNELTLSSTNLDIYCADKIKSEVSTAGEISVSAKQVDDFHNFVVIFRNFPKR